MLVKELPKCIENKTFGNIKEFMVFVYEEQIVTEFGELTDNEVSLEMKNNLEEARKISNSDFINF